MTLVLINEDVWRTAGAQFAGLDVYLVSVSPREDKPGREVVEFLEANPESSVILVRFRKKRYEKELAKLLGRRSLQCVSSIDVALTFLPPRQRQESEAPLPPCREIFLSAAAREPKLLLADQALEHAGRLDDSCRPFIKRAADALAEYASGDAAIRGRLDDLMRGKLLQFANVADQVWIKFTVRRQDGTIVIFEKLTQWHLKPVGERGWMPRERTPRVYFHTVSVDGSTRVVVLFCGPHPPRGTTVDVTVTLRELIEVGDPRPSG